MRVLSAGAVEKLRGIVTRAWRTICGRMRRTDPEYLLARVQAVRELFDEAEDNWALEDVRDLTVEVAEYLRGAMQVPTLEAELTARTKIDATALDEAVAWLRAVPSQEYAGTYVDGSPLDTAEALNRMGNTIKSIRSPEKLDELEVGLRIALVLDGDFSVMLMALPEEHPVFAKLEEKLREKLKLLPDVEAVDFWARLRREVDPSLDMPLRFANEVAPKDFFALGDAVDVRARIAKYIASIRPALVRRTFASGQMHVPAGHSGVASILSWTDKPSTRTWSTRDRTLIHAVGRLVAVSPVPDDELAAALGVRPDGYFMHRAKQEALCKLDRRGSKAVEQKRIFHELRKVLLILEHRHVVVVGRVEEALRAYKFGLEVMAPDVRDEMSTKNELRLQRELVRFLVERNILAYGTKFGWSETDVVAHDDIGAVVIETKVEKSAPSEKDVNHWLSQLGSYMDQRGVGIRGVLAIYNYGASSIVARQVTLRGKFLVIAINLCESSPSKRKTSVVIEPGSDEGDEVVRVFRAGDPGARA